MRKTIIALGVLSAFGVGLHAQLIISSPGSIQIDFDSTIVGVNNGPYAGTGFRSTPDVGQLDSDAWRVGGVDAAGDAFGADTTGLAKFTLGTSSGGESGGGLYAFDDGPGGVIDGRAFGVQPTGTVWTPGTLTLKLENASGVTIDRLEVSYTALVFNNENRVNRVSFSHGATEQTLFSSLESSVDSPETEDASPGWVAHEVSVVLEGMGLADGGYYYLGWHGDDVSGGGSRDEFAVDNIRLTQVPEPGETALISVLGLLTYAGWRRFRRG